MASGSAALLCGKAQPFRKCQKENFLSLAVRKGRAFPHSKAAEPLTIVEN
jgi:hypothetical protein